MIKETRVKFMCIFFCKNFDWEKFNEEFNHEAAGVNSNWKYSVMSNLDREEYCFSIEVKNKKEWEKIAIDAEAYNIKTKLCCEIDYELEDAQD